MPFLALAQKTDTTKSAQVKTNITPKKFINQNIDSVQKQFFVTQDATSLLEANSNTFVRNYGLSNLSTLSIRGSSVAQTNVLWNGVPIQNTMLGLTDLSTVPNFFFDNMSVFPSGFNQKNSVQSIAGSLNLENENKFSAERHWRAALLMGYESFENAILGAKLGVAEKRWNAQIKYYNRQGKNRYSFFNTDTKLQDTIRHAFSSQEQLLADVGYKLNKHNIFSFHYWRIKNEREIAPLSYENNEQRVENNLVNRASVVHRFVKNKVLLKTSAGATMDSFRYTDGQSSLLTRARVINVPIQSSGTYFMNDKSDVGLSYSGQFSFYNQQDRKENLSQNALQFFYNNTDVWHGVQANIFVQKQFASIGQNPWNYGLRLARKVKKQYFVYASFNSNYRIPTLSELYYFPGGNENLLPESAKNLELGGRMSVSKNNIKLTNNFSLYSRWVDDWIIWSGSAVFFPDNIAEVWSRGVENNFSILFTKDKWRLRNDFLFAYNRATSQKPYFVNDQTVGKQIPYVPRTSWKNNLYVQRNNISFQLNYSYTGYRFITRDESAFVNSYHLLNAFLGYEHRIKKLQFELQFRVNNITSVAYESVRGRIMPHRNFGVSLLTELRY